MNQRRMIASVSVAVALILGCSSIGVQAQTSQPSGEQRMQQLADDLRAALAGEPVEVTVQHGSVELVSSADYVYPSGAWQLKPEAPVLSKIAPVLAPLQHTKIVVRGYTDTTPVGTQLQQAGIANNLDLSSKRANTIVTYLQSQGVNPDLLSSQAFGEAHSVAPNDTPEGQAKNRRVEIYLVGDGT